MSPNFYNENSTELAQQYLSKSFEEVHQSRSHFFPSIIDNPNARILDLGAGSCRDAKYFAELADKTHNTKNNIQIFAVEPATELSIIGQNTTQGLNVNWLEQKRTATEVRNRFEQLKQQTPEIAQYVWSAKSLKKKYGIDHSMPLTRWSNNDLWNLLPTDSQVNNQKSDRLPTEYKLKQSKEFSTGGKKLGLTMQVREASASYEISANFISSPATLAQTKNSIPAESKRFFTEANIALAGLNSDNTFLMIYLKR